MVSRLLADIISYANEKISGEDILMPKFCINEDVATVRLLINTDGAAVSKSPPPIDMATLFSCGRPSSKEKAVVRKYCARLPLCRVRLS